MQHNFEKILEDLIEDFLEQGHGDTIEVYLALSAILEKYHSIIDGAPQEQWFMFKKDSLWNRIKNLLKIQ